MKCHKVKFDKKTAKSILNDRKDKGKKWSREKRIYECPICGKWHLTSDEDYEEREFLGVEELVFKSRWESLMK